MKAEIDYARLRAWMDARDLGEGPIEGVAFLSGGTQNILVRFSRGDRGYVLRRPPWQVGPGSNETMRREARVLSALAGTSVPHARLIAHCADEAILGAAFYVMEPVDGFNATTALPDLHAGSAPVRHRMGLAVVEGIADLGALDYEALGLAGFGKPQNYLERQVARWASQLSGYAEHPGWPGPGSLPDVERVGRWLQSHRPAGSEPGILHGDYQLSNVMFRHDGPELAAIIDWELATIGDPLLDLGSLLASWPSEDHPDHLGLSVEPWVGFPSADELVAHYRARSVRDLGAIDWYAVMACYKLGIILEGAHARACAGRAPRATGDRLHTYAVDLFERAWRWIG
jgi:aminoglycoside phosphotransferase (APT) family kinase protein